MTSEETLRLLSKWYLEVEGDTTKSNLLCKLAVLELCGWIEIEFDRLVRHVGGRSGCKADWVEATVIGKTYGFKFDEHFRGMICRLVGESTALRVDVEMDASFPGSLARLKSLLGQLWKERSAFAHAHLESNLATQITFRAPSWSVVQHRDLKVLIREVEQCIEKILGIHFPSQSSA